MIFQRFNLVGRLSVLTNGLTGRLNHKPRLPKLFGLFTDRERDIAIDALAALGTNDHALNLLFGASAGNLRAGRAVVVVAEVHWPDASSAGIV
jgi:phosphonate transport system ATP-binding protein